jgi:hypothetical protein
MATERVIDLENHRYADREYAGEIPVSTAARDEEARAEYRACALASLRQRAASGGNWLTTSDLRDLLIVIGTDEL